MRVLDRVGPDRLEVSGRFLASLGTWARAQRVPSLALVRRRADAVLAQQAPGWLPTRRLAAACAEGFASRFDTIVCPSRWSAAEFTRLGVTNTVQVPLGVDLATFHPVRRQTSLRSSLGAPGSLLLACVGRLTAQRRPELAVDSLRCLLRRGVAASLVIVGAGPLERRLRAAAAELPVTFLEPPAGPPEAAALLATVDVLLSPAPGGTFGISALRALACGTPVVGTRSGALVDLLGVAGPDGRDRSVQASGGATWSHPAAFATAVTDLAALPTSQRRLSARAVAEGFPWQASVDRMLALHGGGQRAPRAVAPPRVTVGSNLASGRPAS